MFWANCNIDIPLDSGLFLILHFTIRFLPCGGEEIEQMIEILKKNEAWRHLLTATVGIKRIERSNHTEAL